MHIIRTCILIGAATLCLVFASSDPAQAYRPCPPGYSYYGGQCIPNNANPNPWGGYGGGYGGNWGPYGPRDPNKNRSGCSASLLACQQQCEAMRPKMHPQNYYQCRQTCQMGFEACVY